VILSVHQPAYLPWLGLFDKIHRSDVFVFLDTVQFEKNSYINRNQIKTDKGALWLTLPVLQKGHTSSTLLETQIDNAQGWKKKHLNSIYHNYRKAPGFSEKYAKLESIYRPGYERVADLCFDHLRFWMEELGIALKIERARDLGLTEKKSDLIRALCRHFKADHYLSGILGKNYLDLDTFKQDGISVEFQDYTSPVYPQLHGDFISNLSVLDAWMNGAEKLL
jgi:hypothetical protein